MPAPTILTSDDVGAPTLSGTDGDLYNVLKWALPLLGWSIAFDDAVNFRIAFRNDNIDGGSGSYLRFVDKAADHGGTAQAAQVNAYETMSDLNTGTRKTPNTDASYWQKSRLADATVRKYRIWGDKYRFVLAVWHDLVTNDDRIVLTLAGDLVSYDPADLGFFLKQALNSSGPSSTRSVAYLQATGEAGHFCVRSKDGTLGPQQSHLWGWSPNNIANSSFWNPGETTGGAYLSPADGEAKFVRYSVASNLEPRGHFPGIYLPCGAWRAAVGSYATIVAASTPDGIHNLQYVSSTTNLSSNNSNPHSLLIDETDGWGVI